MLVPVRAVVALSLLGGLLVALTVPSLAADAVAVLGVARGEAAVDETGPLVPQPRTVPSTGAPVEVATDEPSTTPSETHPYGTAVTATRETVAAEDGGWLVTHVVDGDTLDASRDGVTERVRVVGIDTPERGECGFGEAKEALAEMVLARGVELVPGAQDERDRYGRLLAYVDLTGTDPLDAGLALIAGGYAIARYDSRDGYGQHLREADYIAADQRGELPAGCAPMAPVAVVDAPGEIGAGACDPAYPGVCIPSGPPDLDCGGVPDRDFRVLAPDPHTFDGNGDGVGCVS